MDPAGVTLALELVLAIDTSARLVRLDITTATTPDRHRAGATFPLCLHYRALHHASLAVDPKRVDQAVRAYGCVGSPSSLGEPQCFHRQAHELATVESGCEAQAFVQ